jgi:hypothetical protein
VDEQALQNNHASAWTMIDAAFARRPVVFAVCYFAWPFVVKLLTRAASCPSVWGKIVQLQLGKK